MKLIRKQEKDGFVWYEFIYNDLYLLHYSLETIVKDILFFTGKDLRRYLFNYNLN